VSRITFFSILGLGTGNDGHRKRYGEMQMSNVPVWFERKFEFSFPLELYPSLLTRLRGTPARLEEIVRGYSKEILVKKENGKWSAQEQTGHLSDLEPLWLTRVDDFTSGRSELTAADLSNRKTDDANHNARPLNQILAEFRAARLTLVNRVERLDPAQFANTMLHPRLKQPMRLIDHLYLVAEHDDHHLARIWELIRN
jgi:uncharacterized damage-inducible protein DinB